MSIRNAPLEQRITSRMNKNDRIAIVNLHHGLGQCRKDTWEDIGPYFASENISLNFREVSTLQSVYRYELTETVELSLADLARRIHLKNAVTSQTVTHLVDKGLMRRVIADDDRRKVIISLTERGREIAEGIALRADRYLEKYLSVLTDKEFATFVKLARKLNPGLPY